MKSVIAFAFILVAASAQVYDSTSMDMAVHPYPYAIIYDELPLEQDPELHMELPGLRHRRDVTLLDHKTADGRIFGTVGQNDNGLFGRAGVERNIFNDHRGQLNAQAHGTRTIGPYGSSSALGGGLNYQNSNAAASLDYSKQIHGPTSWSAAGGGRWPVGKNGDFGVDGTYSRMGGIKDYGARGVFNYRF